MHITQIDWLLLQAWYSDRVALNIRLKSSLQEFYTDYTYFCNKRKPDYQVLGKIRFHNNFTKILSNDPEKKNIQKRQTRDGLFFYGLCIKLDTAEIESLIQKESEPVINHNQ